MTILDQILVHKRSELEANKQACPESLLRALAKERGPSPSFSAALTSVPMAVIAEIKRRSPSAGVIREPFDPGAIARSYASAGAQAVSVLMDEPYFGGGEADFTLVRDAVSLPLLFKEFVLDPWQVWQAASLGASAVLLIAAALPGRQLSELADQCRVSGREVLIEVHDEYELERALSVDAELIGINNRDLRTFHTSIETTLRLASRVPSGRVLVSESGISTPSDLARLHAVGARAVLVGESLLRHPDPGAALRTLLAWQSLR